MLTSSVSRRSTSTGEHLAPGARHPVLLPLSLSHMPLLAPNAREHVLPHSANATSLHTPHPLSTCYLFHRPDRCLFTSYFTPRYRCLFTRVFRVVLEDFDEASADDQILPLSVPR